uniref:Methyltransf_21 domain-containing protein n=1 Tax=Caenorhabditis tropicalis TaxID=1561998 RepID=A0A1I7TBX1_9PELO
MEPYSYNLLDKNVETRRSSVFNFRNFFWAFVFLVFLYIIVNSRKVEEIPLSQEEIDKIDSDSSISPIFKSFYKCVKPKLLPYKGDYKEFWFQYTEVTAACDNLDAYDSLDIRPSRNRDEIKYVLFPRTEENLTMITLGIGHDVSAEIGLKELYPKIEFFGADPSPEQNKNLYELNLGGKYFQYSVSDRNRMSESVVLEKEGYKKEVTQHISIDSFIKNIVQKSRIDILWIDIEGNEYPILNQLHQNEQLDREGIKICQMNVEMHKDMSNDPNFEMQQFHDFVWKVLEDRKYVLMKPFFVKYLHFRFVRLFIVNVSDKECTDLYIK